MNDNNDSCTSDNDDSIPDEDGDVALILNGRGTDDDAVGHRQGNIRLHDLSGSVYELYVRMKGTGCPRLIIKISGRNFSDRPQTKIVPRNW